MPDNQIQTTPPEGASNTPAQEVGGTPPPEGAEPKTYTPDYVAQLRRENAKYRTQAQANADKAARLDELEAASKTELQKLTEDRDAHKHRGDAAAEAMARYEVAMDKGLTRSQAKRLVGSTYEELAADADEMLSDLGAGKQKQPRPNPAQGVAEVETGSGDWLRDQFMRT